MSDHFTVNSDITEAMYISKVKAWFREHRYLTFAPPRIGPDRSIDQNSLLHVWLTEFAAHLTPCHKKEVTPGMLEGIKRSMKQSFYQQSGYEWMIHTVRCPLTGREKRDWTSSANWGRGEMFTFLSWLQLFAAEYGCILESKGKFNQLQKKQNAA